MTRALETLGAFAVLAFGLFLIFMAACHGELVWALGGALLYAVLFMAWARRAAKVMVQNVRFEVRAEDPK